MQIIIAGGSGFIGHALITALLAQQHQVTVIGRNTTKLAEIFGSKTTNISWETFTRQPQVWLTDTDWVINLAGTNVAARRWSKKQKSALLTSRVETAGMLAREIAILSETQQPPVLFSASGIGIYNTVSAIDHDTHLDTETTPIDFNKSPSFLGKVSRAWERATWPARDAGARVVNMRFGVVLGKEAGALPRLVKPFKFGIGGKVGTGLQPFCWISLTDLVRAIIFVFQKKSIDGPVNFVAPEIPTQHQLANDLSDFFHRPAKLSTPAWLIKLMLGQMGDELILQGQNVAPKKLLDAGFIFNYPDIPAALSHIYQQEDKHDSKI